VAKALYYARLAAAKGYDAAQSILDGIYYDGPGTSEDYKESLQWFQSAEPQGNAVAITAIGDPAVFVSVDAMHQGPQGGGPVIAIVAVGD